MPNDNYANEPNQSRSEDIIQSILDNTEYDEEARSRIEYLLIELKNAIEGGGGGGGVTSYAPLTEKPKIDNNTLQAGNNSSSDLGLQTKLTFDSAPTESSTNPVTSDGVYIALDSKANSSDVYNKSAVDAALTAKADKSTTYTKSEIDTSLGSKQNTISDLPTIRSGAALGATAVQPISGKGLSTNDYTNDEKTKLAGIAEGAEVNEIVGIKVNNTIINPDTNKVINITVPTTAEDVSALPDTTKYAAALSLTINSSTFVMTGQLKDQNGDNLGTAQTIDLPLESVVVGGSYNSQTKKVVLTLQNGNTIEFSVADLVSGLQTELSASNKLNPAYIDYDSTHRAVSDTEKSTWNGKQNAIDSSHKLSADLVDDTNATNKFATAEELEQIQTNKNNILSLTQYGGGINKFQVTATTATVNGITFTVNADKTVTATGSIADSSQNAIFTLGAYTAVSGDVLSEGFEEASSKAYIYTRGGSTSLTTAPYRAILAGDIGVQRTYACVITGTTVGQVNITFKPMICNSDSYAKSGVYQPYALSNAELTAKEQQNKNNILLNRHYGVKNIFIPTAGNLSNPSGFTGTITRNADNSYTINGSTGGDVYYLLLGRIKMPVGTFVLYARPTNKTGIFVYNDGDWADNDDSRYKTFSQPSSQGIFLRIAANQTLENYTIYPMICDLTAWNMSRDYERGALSNVELTEEVNTAKNNILTYAIPTCTDTAFTTSTTGEYVCTGISFTVPSGEVWEFFVADKYNGNSTTNFSNGLLVSDSSSAITNVSVIAENTQVPSVSGISYWVRQLTGLTPKRANATTYYVWTNRAVTASCNIFVCLRRVF